MSEEIFSVFKTETSEMFETSIQGVGLAENLTSSDLARELSRVNDENFRNIHSNTKVHLTLARRILRVRKTRDAILGTGLFFDPAWDLMLSLYVSKLQQVRIKVTSLIEDSGVAPTTALRWINALCERGLLLKWSNPTDARSTLVELSDDGAVGMTALFADLQKNLGDLES